ncbi:MAG TPA: hypothetical protein DCR04_04465 [Flavobacteriales bacterium]|nr:hypothetical protein [Flavobacteriales bacterium]
MIDPKETISTIPKVLDEGAWHLESDTTDVKIYSKYGVCNSTVIGFKTITEHPVSALEVFELLKDVNKAMELVNDQFIRGEVLESWPTDFDPQGNLVRTSFSMPWPFTNREFPHGQHTKKLDETTYIVGYTPIERGDIPVQDGFIRCPMYISGQRITQLQNGACKVEHLMVYELGGSVSPKFQDGIMKAGHIGAYKAEWRKLREVLFPQPLEDVSNSSLSRLMVDALSESKSWKKIKDAKTGHVSSGRLAYCPKIIYRTEIEVVAPIRQVVDVLADKSLEYLGKWNKEFIQGFVLKELSITPEKAEWLIHVQYATPGPISNREYVYYFSREWLSDSEAIILYCSVQHDKPVPTGFERSILYPTVHRCISTENGTIIEHLLATDLKGKLGSVQDGLLKSGLVDAHIRDLNSQTKLFKEIAQ